MPQIPQIIQHVALCDANNAIKSAGIKHEDAFMIQPTINVTRDQKNGFTYSVQFKTSLYKALLLQESYDPSQPLRGEKPNTILKTIQVVQGMANTGLVTLNYSPPEVGDLPADELAESISEAIKLAEVTTDTATSEQEFTEKIFNSITTSDPTTIVARKNGIGWDTAFGFFSSFLTEDTTTTPGSSILTAQLQKRRRIYYKDERVIEEFYTKPTYISPNADSTGQGIITCDISQSSDGIWTRDYVTRTKQHEIILTAP